MSRSSFPFSHSPKHTINTPHHPQHHHNSSQDEIFYNPKDHPLSDNEISTAHLKPRPAPLSPPMSTKPFHQRQPPTGPELSYPPVPVPTKDQQLPQRVSRNFINNTLETYTTANPVEHWLYDRHSFFQLKYDAESNTYQQLYHHRGLPLHPDTIETTPEVDYYQNFYRPTEHDKQIDAEYLAHVLFYRKGLEEIEDIIFKNMPAIALVPISKPVQDFIDVLDEYQSPFSEDLPALGPKPTPPPGCPIERPRFSHTPNPRQIRYDSKTHEVVDAAPSTFPREWLQYFKDHDEWQNLRVLHYRRQYPSQEDITHEFMYSFYKPITEDHFRDRMLTDPLLRERLDQTSPETHEDRILQKENRLLQNLNEFQDPEEFIKRHGYQHPDLEIAQEQLDKNLTETVFQKQQRFRGYHSVHDPHYFDFLLDPGGSFEDTIDKWGELEEQINKTFEIMSYGDQLEEPALRLGGILSVGRFRSNMMNYTINRTRENLPALMRKVAWRTIQEKQFSSEQFDIDLVELSQIIIDLSDSDIIERWEPVLTKIKTKIAKGEFDFLMYAKRPAIAPASREDHVQRFNLGRYDPDFMVLADQEVVYTELVRAAQKLEQDIAPFDHPWVELERYYLDVVQQPVPMDIQEKIHEWKMHNDVVDTLIEQTSENAVQLRQIEINQEMDILTQLRKGLNQLDRKNVDLCTRVIAEIQTTVKKVAVLGGELIVPQNIFKSLMGLNLNDIKQYVVPPSTTIFAGPMNVQNANMIGMGPGTGANTNANTSLSPIDRVSGVLSSLDAIASSLFDSFPTMGTQTESTLSELKKNQKKTPNLDKETINYPLEKVIAGVDHIIRTIDSRNNLKQFHQVTKPVPHTHDARLLLLEKVRLQRLRDFTKRGFLSKSKQAEHLLKDVKPTPELELLDPPNPFDPYPDQPAPIPSPSINDHDTISSATRIKNKDVRTARQRQKIESQQLLVSQNFDQVFNSSLHTQETWFDQDGIERQRIYPHLLGRDMTKLEAALFRAQENIIDSQESNIKAYRKSERKVQRLLEDLSYNRTLIGSSTKNNITAEEVPRFQKRKSQIIGRRNAAVIQNQLRNPHLPPHTKYLLNLRLGFELARAQLIPGVDYDGDDWLEVNVPDPPPRKPKFSRYDHDVGEHKIPMFQQYHAVSNETSFHDNELQFINWRMVEKLAAIHGDFDVDELKRDVAKYFSNEVNLKDFMHRLHSDVDTGLRLQDTILDPKALDVLQTLASKASHIDSNSPQSDMFSRSSVSNLSSTSPFSGSSSSPSSLSLSPSSSSPPSLSSSSSRPRRTTVGKLFKFNTTENNPKSSQHKPKLPPRTSTSVFGPNNPLNQLDALVLDLISQDKIPYIPGFTTLEDLVHEPRIVAQPMGTEHQFMQRKQILMNEYFHRMTTDPKRFKQELGDIKPWEYSGFRRATEDLWAVQGGLRFNNGHRDLDELEIQLHMNEIALTDLTDVEINLLRMRWADGEISKYGPPTLYDKFGGAFVPDLSDSLVSQKNNPWRPRNQDMDLSLDDFERGIEYGGLKEIRNDPMSMIDIHHRMYTLNSPRDKETGEWRDLDGYMSPFLGKYPTFGTEFTPNSTQQFLRLQYMSMYYPAHPELVRLKLEYPGLVDLINAHTISSDNSQLMADAMKVYNIQSLDQVDEFSNILPQSRGGLLPHESYENPYMSHFDNLMKNKQNIPRHDQKIATFERLFDEAKAYYSTVKGTKDVRPGPPSDPGSGPGSGSGPAPNSETLPAEPYSALVSASRDASIPYNERTGMSPSQLRKVVNKLSVTIQSQMHTQAQTHSSDHPSSINSSTDASPPPPSTPQTFTQAWENFTSSSSPAQKEQLASLPTLKSILPTYFGSKIPVAPRFVPDHDGNIYCILFPKDISKILPRPDQFILPPGMKLVYATSDGQQFDLDDARIKPYIDDVKDDIVPRFEDGHGNLVPDEELEELVANCWGFKHFKQKTIHGYLRLRTLGKAAKTYASVGKKIRHKLFKFQLHNLSKNDPEAISQSLGGRRVLKNQYARDQEAKKDEDHRQKLLTCIDQYYNDVIDTPDQRVLENRFSKLQSTYDDIIFRNSQEGQFYKNLELNFGKPMSSSTTIGKSIPLKQHRRDQRESERESERQTKFNQQQLQNHIFNINNDTNYTRGSFGTAGKSAISFNEPIPQFHTIDNTPMESGWGRHVLRGQARYGGDPYTTSGDQRLPFEPYDKVRNPDPHGFVARQKNYKSLEGNEPYLVNPAIDQRFTQTMNDFEWDELNPGQNPSWMKVLDPEFQVTAMSDQFKIGEYGVYEPMVDRNMYDFKNSGIYRQFRRKYEARGDAAESSFEVPTDSVSTNPLTHRFERAIPMFRDFEPDAVNAASTPVGIKSPTFVTIPKIIPEGPMKYSKELVKQDKEYQLKLDIAKEYLLNYDFGSDELDAEHKALYEKFEKAAKNRSYGIKRTQQLLPFLDKIREMDGNAVPRELVYLALRHGADEPLPPALIPRFRSDGTVDEEWALQQRVPFAYYATENMLDEYEVVREASRPPLIDPLRKYARKKIDLFEEGYEKAPPLGFSHDGYGRNKARNLYVANIDPNSWANAVQKPSISSWDHPDLIDQRFIHDENGQYVMTPEQFDKIHRANKKRIETWHFEFEKNYFDMLQQPFWFPPESPRNPHLINPADPTYLEREDPLNSAYYSHRMRHVNQDLFPGWSTEMINFVELRAGVPDTPFDYKIALENENVDEDGQFVGKGFSLSGFLEPPNGNPGSVEEIRAAMTNPASPEEEHFRNWIYRQPEFWEKLIMNLPLDPLDDKQSRVYEVAASVVDLTIVLNDYKWENKLYRKFFSQFRQYTDKRHTDYIHALILQYKRKWIGLYKDAHTAALISLIDAWSEDFSLHHPIHIARTLYDSKAKAEVGVLALQDFKSQIDKDIRDKDVLAGRISQELMTRWNAIESKGYDLGIQPNIVATPAFIPYVDQYLPDKYSQEIALTSWNYDNPYKHLRHGLPKHILLREGILLPENLGTFPFNTQVQMFEKVCRDFKVPFKILPDKTIHLANASLIRTHNIADQFLQLGKFSEMLYDFDSDYDRVDTTNLDSFMKLNLSLVRALFPPWIPSPITAMLEEQDKEQERNSNESVYLHLLDPTKSDPRYLPYVEQKIASVAAYVNHHYRISPEKFYHLNDDQQQLHYYYNPQHILHSYKRHLRNLSEKLLKQEKRRQFLLDQGEEPYAASPKKVNYHPLLEFEETPRLPFSILYKSPLEFQYNFEFNRGQIPFSNISTLAPPHDLFFLGRSLFQLFHTHPDFTTALTSFPTIILDLNPKKTLVAERERVQDLIIKATLEHRHRSQFPEPLPPKPRSLTAKESEIPQDPALVEEQQALYQQFQEMQEVLQHPDFDPNQQEQVQKHLQTIQLRLQEIEKIFNPPKPKKPKKKRVHPSDVQFRSVLHQYLPILKDLDAQIRHLPTHKYKSTRVLFFSAVRQIHQLCQNHIAIAREIHEEQIPGFLYEIRNTTDHTQRLELEKQLQKFELDALDFKHQLETSAFHQTMELQFEKWSTRYQNAMTVMQVYPFETNMAKTLIRLSKRQARQISLGKRPTLPKRPHLVKKPRLKPIQLPFETNEIFTPSVSTQSKKKSTEKKKSSTLQTKVAKKKDKKGKKDTTNTKNTKNAKDTTNKKDKKDKKDKKGKKGKKSTTSSQNSKNAKPPPPVVKQIKRKPTPHITVAYAQLFTLPPGFTAVYVRDQLTQVKKLLEFHGQIYKNFDPNSELELVTAFYKAELDKVSKIPAHRRASHIENLKTALAFKAKKIFDHKTRLFEELGIVFQRQQELIITLQCLPSAFKSPQKFAKKLLKRYQSRYAVNKLTQINATYNIIRQVLTTYNQERQLLARHQLSERLSIPNDSELIFEHQSQLAQLRTACFFVLIRPRFSQVPHRPQFARNLILHFLCLDDDELVSSRSSTSPSTSTSSLKLSTKLPSEPLPLRQLLPPPVTLPTDQPQLVFTRPQQELIQAYISYIHAVFRLNHRRFPEFFHKITQHYERNIKILQKNNAKYAIYKSSKLVPDSTPISIWALPNVRRHWRTRLMPLQIKKYSELYAAAIDEIQAPYRILMQDSLVDDGTKPFSPLNKYVNAAVGLNMAELTHAEYQRAENAFLDNDIERLLGHPNPTLLNFYYKPLKFYEPAGPPIVFNTHGKLVDSTTPEAPLWHPVIFDGIYSPFYIQNLRIASFLTRVSKIKGLGVPKYIFSGSKGTVVLEKEIQDEFSRQHDLLVRNKALHFNQFSAQDKKRIAQQYQRYITTHQNLSKKRINAWESQQQVLDRRLARIRANMEHRRAQVKKNPLFGTPFQFEPLQVTKEETTKRFPAFNFKTRNRLQEMRAEESSARADSNKKHTTTNNTKAATAARRTGKPSRASPRFRSSSDSPSLHREISPTDTDETDMDIPRSKQRQSKQSGKPGHKHQHQHQPRHPNNNRSKNNKRPQSNKMLSRKCRDEVGDSLSSDDDDDNEIVTSSINIPSSQQNLQRAIISSDGTRMIIPALGQPLLSRASAEINQFQYAYPDRGRYSGSGSNTDTDADYNDQDHNGTYSYHGSYQPTDSISDDNDDYDGDYGYFENNTSQDHLSSHRDNFYTDSDGEYSFRQ